MADSIFLSAVKNVTDGKLSVLDLLNTAESLKLQGRVDLATQLYKVWSAFNPAEPLAHVIQFNLAVMLSDAGDLAGAREALERAIAGNPDFYPAYINLGGVLERGGQVDGAVAQWSALAERLASVTAGAVRYKASALKQIGRVLETYQRYESAEATLQQSLDLDQNQGDVIEHLLATRMLQCKWPVLAPWEGVSGKTLLRGMSPLSMCSYTDDPVLHLANGYNHNRTAVGPPTLNLQAERATPPAAADARLRIGYVSSDLRGHAIGYLMAEVFELHDRRAFEVFVYYCGPQANGDPIQERTKAAVDHWVDISRMGDEAAARRIAADGIDILVDVNGYTRDARTRVIGMRPAPVIVNWLGYPGTMASPYHHYIIADEWIVPPDHEIYFSEKVLRLPCYQPNDRKRVASPNRPTRAQAGLPEDAFVYCCFNGLQKLTRFTFERWMTILMRVPNSVLWLLDGTEAVNTKLREAATGHGIAPERLVFAGKMQHADHLARYPLADLFLDTVPYGAHTTASDALWAGVPILTLSGRSFPARVCGSLARSAGQGDLVCATPEEYVERAVAFGNDRALVQPYKQRLAETRDGCTLFATDTLVQHLEGLYRQMQDEYRQGALPVPDLRNLDVYQEVGMEENHDAVEVLTVPDYRGWYRAKLARRHTLVAIPEDARLWTREEIAKAFGA